MTGARESGAGCGRGDRPTTRDLLCNAGAGAAAGQLFFVAFFFFVCVCQISLLDSLGFSLFCSFLS